MGEMISIERIRYEDLLKSEEILEAIEDACTMKVVAEHLANPTEGVPDAFVSRLLDGENPVLVYRDWRCTTQAELARKAGLHRVRCMTSKPQSGGARWIPSRPSPRR